MNTITIVGNLGSDPELTYTTAGKAKVKFSVADTRKVNEVTETTWHRCVAWGKSAENIAAIFSKGNRVIVNGRYKMDEYKTKTGEKKSTLEVLVDDAGLSLRFEIPSEDRPSFLPKGNSSVDEEEPF